MNSKTILITGGTGKLGLPLIGHFLRNNHTVIFTSRKKAKINHVYNLFGQYRKQCKLYGVAIDFTKESFSKEITSFLGSKNIHPEVLINNARDKNYLRLNSNLLISREEFLGEFTLGVIASYELSMALANYKKSKLKNIINISSMYGIVVQNPILYKNPERETFIQYGVAKAGLIQLTKELAVRFAKKGIRVNAVSFGGVEGGVSESFKKKYAKLCPAGRMLKIQEVEGALDFLVSDASSGMTGHNMVVDGGWTIL